MPLPIRLPIRQRNFRFRLYLIYIPIQGNVYNASITSFINESSWPAFDQLRICLAPAACGCTFNFYLARLGCYAV